MEFQKGYSQFLESLKNEGKSGTTLKNYKQDLRSYEFFLARSFSRIPTMNDVTTENIQRFLAYNQKERQLQANTCQRQYYTLSSFCSFAYRKGFIHQNEALNVERIRVKKEEPITVTEIEFAQILKQVEKKVIKRVLFFLYHTGLRISECLLLTLEDIDFENQLVHVHNGKGGKYRSVPLLPQVVDELRNYLENERPNDIDSNRLFATKRSGALSDVYVNRHLQKAVNKIGLSKKVTAHTLRHSFASNLVKKGVHHVHIQKILGHQSLASTGIYTHVDENDMEESLLKLNEEGVDINEHVS